MHFSVLSTCMRLLLFLSSPCCLLHSTRVLSVSKGQAWRVGSLELGTKTTIDLFVFFSSLQSSLQIKPYWNGCSCSSGRIVSFFSPQWIQTYACRIIMVPGRQGLQLYRQHRDAGSRERDEIMICWNKFSSVNKNDFTLFSGK